MMAITIRSLLFSAVPLFHRTVLSRVLLNRISLDSLFFCLLFFGFFSSFFHSFIGCSSSEIQYKFIIQKKKEEEAKTHFLKEFPTSTAPYPGNSPLRL